MRVDPKRASEWIGLLIAGWFGLAVLWLGTVGLYLLTQRMMGVC